MPYIAKIGSKYAYTTYYRDYGLTDDINHAQKYDSRRKALAVALVLCRGLNIDTSKIKVYEVRSKSTGFGIFGA